MIHAVGDVNLDGRYIPELRREGWDLAFEALDGIFQRDDLTIINLECDPSEIGTPLSNKPYSFRCDLAGLPSLVRAGVDVAGMGNNHAADYGFESLVDGRANLERAGLRPIGAGADLAEANEPRIFEIGGWTIGVVAFSGTSGFTYGGAYPKTPELVNPWFATPDTPGIAPANDTNMTAVVSALDPLVDIVIVSLHQGEYNETLRPEAVEVGRIHTLIAAGADVVVAHHHHRVLPFEYIEGVPIFWGMGNFVWRRLDPERNVSAIAEIVIDPDGGVTGRLIPARIERPGRPVLRGLPDPSVRSDREKLA